MKTHKNVIKLLGEASAVSEGLAGSLEEAMSVIEMLEEALEDIVGRTDGDDCKDVARDALRELAKREWGRDS